MFDYKRELRGMSEELMEIIFLFCIWGFICLFKCSVCMIEIMDDNFGSCLFVNNRKVQFKLNQMNYFFLYIGVYYLNMIDELKYIFFI